MLCQSTADPESEGRAEIEEAGAAVSEVFMEGEAEAVEGVRHPKLRKTSKLKLAPYVSTHARPDAKYVTAGRQEYCIERDRNLFTIYRYKGGKVPDCLSGSFTSYNLAEQALISFLKSDDPRGVAIYPGCRSKKL